MFKLLILTLVVFSKISFASTNSSWKETFYTDESSYYLKLHKTGFYQRFRVAKKFCSEFKRAEVVLKKAQIRAFSFKRIEVLDNKWPRLYGEQTASCWYEAKVTGLDLNAPQDNDYLIRFIMKDGSDLYFAGYIDSILPAERIRNKIDAIENWISLGAFGATPVEGGGVFFKIWEPLADRVDLFFQRDLGHAYWMKPSTINTLDNRRNYVLYVKDVSVGDEYHYKFLKGGKYEALEVANDEYMSDWKVDPMARRVNYDRKGGSVNGYIHPRAIITKAEGYNWKYDQRSKDFDTFPGSHLIYQIWPATFNAPQYDGEYRMGSFHSIKEKINYIKNLGMNTVELLPVHETRFHTSWGYALDSLMAIDTGLGSVDDLKSLVDHFHKSGIKVLFDVVINHVNNDLLREPLAVGVTRTKFFNGNTPWGPKPDFRNIMVRRWIADSLISLMREYHLDGYRFDMTSAVHNAEGGYKFLQEINALFKMNNASFYSTAEELPDNIYITRPVEEDGTAFDAQWNDKFKNFFEENFNHYRKDHRWVNVQPLKDAMIGFSDQSHYGDLLHFGPAQRTVNYLGSHDFIGNKDPILRIVSDYFEEENADGNIFYQVNPLDGADPEKNFRLIHNDFTYSVGKVSYGILFTKPGSLLLYQGEELGNDINIENEWSYLAAKNGNTEPSKDIDISRFVGSHRMVWQYLNPEKTLDFINSDDKRLMNGYHNFFKTMINFRKKHMGISKENAFNVDANTKHGLVSYQINDGKNDFFVIANYGGESANYWIDFPFGQNGNWWEEIINSSDLKFGGTSIKFSNIIPQKGSRKNIIRVAPTSIHIFQAKSDFEVKRDLYFVSNLNDWKTSDRFRLHEVTEGIFIVDFHLDIETNVLFKISTANWGIEMGQGDDTHLTYRPDSKNVKEILKRGRYRFTFNAKTFAYSIVELNKLDTMQRY